MSDPISSQSSSKKKKRKLKRKIDNFSNGVGLSPLKIIVSAVLLLGIGFLIFSVAFADRDKGRVAAKPSELKLKQQELSLDQQLEEMLNRRVPINQNFVATIDQLYDMEDQLETIEAKPEVPDSQRKQINMIRLRNKSVVVMLMTQNKISCETEKADLLKYCNEHLQSSDEKMKEATRYWLCVIPAVEFSQNPSTETLQSFVSDIETHSAGFLNEPEHAKTLSSIIVKLSKDKPNAKEYWKEGFKVLSQQFATSENKLIREMGDKLSGLELFGEFNLPTLAHRILWGDPSGPEDLEGALLALEQHPNVDLRNWVVVVKAYEGYLSTDKIEETGSAWQRMSELSEKIEDPEKKKQFQNILARQRTRAMAIGTKFDLSGTLLPEGKPFGLGDQDYTAVIFCDKSKASFSAMMQLGAETKESQLRYRPVLAFEDELTQIDLDSLYKVPRDIAIADHETSKRYFEMLPVDFFPYVVLLDKNGTIVSANLDVQQVPTRVAKYDAIERKARAARNTNDGSLGTVSQ